MANLNVKKHVLAILALGLMALVVGCREQANPNDVAPADAAPAPVPTSKQEATGGANTIDQAVAAPPGVKTGTP
ncbi:MAG: hypothetical protein KIS66_04305 [Fimbriimonadaceae bacterium]|nr:hypothetical protein [Fimbriimonadaceae bacterium]